MSERLREGIMRLGLANANANADCAACGAMA